MSASLFSPDWYRVAEVRPRLRPRAALSRREVRDQDSQIDEDVADQALALIGHLVADRDWLPAPQQLSVVLTDAGEAALAELAEADPLLAASPAWSVPRLREELARHALAALHLFHRGEHYLVRDCRVLIIDEFSDRTVPDRQWADGLHQVIERKEGCGITRRRFTLARLTFQRFFSRYRHLSGMTGTAAEVAGELWGVYGLAVDVIPTHGPSLRTEARDRILPDAASKWASVAAAAAGLREAGRPVLIGTRTVAASQCASAALDALDLPHAVLSADQDAAEAAVIAEAGEAGRITIATNMAGRGTDIRVPADVAAAGWPRCAAY